MRHWLSGHEATTLISKYRATLPFEPVSAVLDGDRISFYGKAGEYCDVERDCFPTPQALGGHVSQTGHSVAGRAIRPERTEYGAPEVPDFEEAHVTHHDTFQALRDRLRSAPEVLEMGFSPFEILSDAVETPRGSEDEFKGWRQSPNNPDTLALWHYASKISNNPNVLHHLSSAQDPKQLQSRLNALDRVAKITQGMVREIDPTYDPKTDTVLLYRGVRGDVATEIGEAVVEGEDFAVTHRAVESWTSDLGVAKTFASDGKIGLVIAARVPVSSILANHFTARLERDEAEYVVATPNGRAVYKHTNVMYPDDIGADELIERSDAWRASLERLAK